MIRFSYERSLVLRKISYARGKSFFREILKPKIILNFVIMQNALRQHADIGETARAPIGCSAATAAAYRARPGVTPDPIRALRARCVTSCRNSRGVSL